MHVKGTPYRTIWETPEREGAVQIIDQRHLPFAFIVETLESIDDVATAIRDMHVRGAGCIGATAAWGMAIAAHALSAESDTSFDSKIRKAATLLCNTRPTAVNLQWAVERQLTTIDDAKSVREKILAARDGARVIAEEDVAACQNIGIHGLSFIQEIAQTKVPGEPVHILTHCNAGWLAFVDIGSATAPIYAAHRAGINVHIWVDETRPRNQGARLTAWEFANEGIPHTIIPDNTGGHLMQHGKVDLVITGSDRTTYTGDVANKIGTYLKALAAKDNNIPFYVALPSSTIDWTTRDGCREIPIEQRNAHEVSEIEGLTDDGVRTVSVINPGSPVANYAFDVTPARLVTGLITERGVCEASESGITALFPENRPLLA